ncbi:MAG: hypothetical protein JWO69_179 [Thermoleophilia bacterium]|jgi:hypothetical protein|nr:hypothetical protein [Thermoleophilia bacterium]
MMYMTHQIEQLVRQLDESPARSGSQQRWTWIAGRRYRGLRRL